MPQAGDDNTVAFGSVKSVITGFLMFLGMSRRFDASVGLMFRARWSLVSRRCWNSPPGRLRYWVFHSDKSDISGFFEDNDDFGCARYRRAMARIGSDREARSETREGACSPRETVECGLLGGGFGGFLMAAWNAGQPLVPRNQ
jgi:hypothetical protein